jgi:hypothetical protein
LYDWWGLVGVLAKKIIEPGK